MSGEKLLKKRSTAGDSLQDSIIVPPLPSRLRIIQICAVLQLPVSIALLLAGVSYIHNCDDSACSYVSVAWNAGEMQFRRTEIRTLTCYLGITAGVVALLGSITGIMAIGRRKITHSCVFSIHYTISCLACIVLMYLIYHKSTELATPIYKHDDMQCNQEHNIVMLILAVVYYVTCLLGLFTTYRIWVRTGTCGG